MNTTSPTGLRAAVIALFCLSFSIVQAQCPPGAPAGTPTTGPNPLCYNYTCNGNGGVDSTAVNCDDGNPYNTDFCDALNGCFSQCLSDSIGQPCDDGLFCTVNDSIDANCNCVGEPYSCPDDGNPWTTEVCQPGLDNCISVCDSIGVSCDDGNPCTENDVVQSDCTCLGTPRDCNDGDPCTINFCHPDTVGGCYSMPAPAGTPTTGPNPVCYNYTCNGNGGLDSTAVNCDDGNPYNTDFCDALNGCFSQCLNDSIGQPCDDGLFCTVNDSIDASCNCVGEPYTCPDDGNPWTTEVCQPGLDNCISVCDSIGVSCDDGNPCTENDVVQSDCTCLGTPRDCNDGDPCTMNFCHPDTVGGCYSMPAPAGTPTTGPNPLCYNYTCNGNGGVDSTAVNCDDGNPNTTDSCVPGVGCSSVCNFAVGTPCDDGMVCTENDAIDANCNCVGTAVTCPDDGNPCTDEQCIPGIGCQSVPASGSPCDDGNPCTVNDVCNNGVCSGTPLDCDDGNPCTLNFCHPDTAGGCYSMPAPAGTPTTGPSVCYTYTCNGSGGLDSTAIDCDDGDPATLDLCDSQTGCYSVPLPLGYGLNGFSYQGVARDASGNVLALQSISVGFRIRNYAVSGTVVYSEGHTVTTDERGLFTLQIGRGTPNVGDFESLVWAESPKFLEVRMDVNGGTNFITIGVEELLPVPYALYSKSIDCMRVSLTGDTLYQGDGCYVIIPGISAANHGGQ